MGCYILRESYQKAKKNYICDALAIIYNDLYQADFSQDELKVIHECFLSGCTIKKGMKYYKQTGVSDGVFYTFRAIPEIRDICIKYDLLDEE